MSKAVITVDQYVAARSAEVRALPDHLRSLVLQVAPEAVEAMKWGAPVFLIAGEAQIYLYGGKGHAHLGFVNGAKLDDPDRVLFGTGESGRHVRLVAGQDVPEATLSALIRQAAAL